MKPFSGPSRVFEINIEQRGVLMKKRNVNFEYLYKSENVQKLASF